MDTASKRHDEDQAPGDSPVIATSSLDKPPCCLVFSPTDPSLLVVGTYNLRSKDAHTDESLSATSDPDAVRRNGGLILCSVGDREITQIQIVDNHDRGILDLKFHGNTIITATSIGTIDIYELQPPAPGSQASFQLRSKIRVADHTTVITSVALDISSNGEKQIAFTASDGRVGLVILPSDLLGQVNSPSSTVIEPRERNIPNVTTHVQRLPERHTLEAWITAFSPTSWNPRSIFSGGDDATLMSHVEHTPGEWTPGLRDRKTHGAGVTALLPLQLSGELSSERLLLTGSYDDRLRVLDLGSARGTTLRRPTVVRELDLGGGVWRIKVLGQSQDDVDGRSTVKLTLAVACMYAGAFVVEVSLVKECDEVWVCELDIMQHMEEHESMCYGVDARPSRSGTAHSLVSCSFYDKRLCLWQWPPRVN